MSPNPHSLKIGKGGRKTHKHQHTNCEDFYVHRPITGPYRIIVTVKPVNNVAMGSLDHFSSCTCVAFLFYHKHLSLLGDTSTLFIVLTDRMLNT